MELHVQDWEKAPHGTMTFVEPTPEYPVRIKGRRSIAITTTRSLSATSGRFELANTD